METKAVEHILDYIEEKGLDIRAFETDRSITVRKLMDKKYPHIREEVKMKMYTTYWLLDS